MAVIKVDVNNFAQEVLKSEKPVLLDMYADWCGPCMMMAPEIEAFAEETDKAYYRYLQDNQPFLEIGKGDKVSFGANVRCVRDAK